MNWGYKLMTAFLAVFAGVVSTIKPNRSFNGITLHFRWHLQKNGCSLLLQLHGCEQGAGFLGRINSGLILQFIFIIFFFHQIVVRVHRPIHQVMGVVVITLLVLYYGYHYAWQPAILNKLYAWLQKTMLRLLRSDRSTSGFLLLGMANGLLPCGMVYVALAASLTSSSLNEGIGLMVFFGIGTLPAMLALSYAGHLLSLPIRYRLRQLVPVFMGLVGLALLLRGLNLGIPYLSPELPALGKEAVICH